jgi:iron only hydrogenase large subunit-like protein
MKKAGFSDIYEVAHGAETTARNEAHEFSGRIASGEAFMTTLYITVYKSMRREEKRSTRK